MFHTQHIRHDKQVSHYFFKSCDMLRKHHENNFSALLNKNDVGLPCGLLKDMSTHWGRKSNCHFADDIIKCIYNNYLRNSKKSKDYVYGIWVYKVLGIWKGYYRVKKSLVSYMQPWNEPRNNKYMKYHSKLAYQLSFRNVSRKVDFHAGGKWFIHGPKRRKENQLLSLKHPC